MNKEIKFEETLNQIKEKIDKEMQFSNYLKEKLNCEKEELIYDLWATKKELYSYAKQFQAIQHQLNCEFGKHIVYTKNYYELYDSLYQENRKLYKLLKLSIKRNK